jgi:hypothetical protein
MSHTMNKFCFYQIKEFHLQKVGRLTEPLFDDYLCDL